MHSRPSRRLSPCLLAGSLLLTACSHRSTVSSPSNAPLTRAERSAFQETSSHADVVAFLDALKAKGIPMGLGEIGRTSEGRTIPYVIASRPLVTTPEAARRTGKPIVYVQGNIHAGEVEGKEALQALIRDLLLEQRSNVLDSIILIAVPIYNGDGNEKLDHQNKNRGAQNGPEMVGQRANGQNFDLNRDYIKADAPETRASLAMFSQWTPDVFVDLHTTDGSYHGYQLTYSPSLNPAGEVAGVSFGAAYARDSLLPELQKRVATRRNFQTFPYGNFSQDEGLASIPKGWVTYDHRPRFGTNYFALRGGIAILSEAYSHDPFKTRVASTYAFVRELLSLVAERRQSVLALARATPQATAAQIPLRARLTTKPFTGDVVYEQLERSADSTNREPGVRAGFRRTGRYVTEAMPVYDRFEPTLTRSIPFGYAVSASDTALIQLLRLHGVAMWQTSAAWQGDVGPQFVIDSTVIAPRPFQGRREVRAEGRWVPAGTRDLAAGTIIIPTDQPLRTLVMYLLEPESDDGAVTWDVGGRSSQLARWIPLRLTTRPSVGMTPLPRGPSH